MPVGKGASEVMLGSDEGIGTITDNDITGGNDRMVVPSAVTVSTSDDDTEGNWKSVDDISSGVPTVLSSILDWARTAANISTEKTRM